MPSLFPYLLNYQFGSITLIRVAAAIALLYMAYRFFAVRSDIASERWPLIGRIPEWLTLFGSLVVCAVGILLFIGLYTQAAAIAGMLLALKDMSFARRYPKIFPLSAGAAAFLFVMCLSLLFLGAGAFAFDLPL